MSDSHYSMLLSESLLKHGSFALDRHFRPPVNPSGYPGFDAERGWPLHIEAAGGHLYYQFAPGTSVLSIPYVALMALAGVSPSRADGSYDVAGEVRIERGLAAILMALVAWLFYVLARRYLPPGWSVAVALAGALGTPIWSTASRAMWAHTWGVVLTSVIILLLARLETGQDGHLILMATLSAWLFFVRPSQAVVIACISAYIVTVRGRGAFPYLLTGVFWGGMFAWYSWAHFGHILPPYFRHHAGDKLFVGARFAEGLLGVLISPSRGLIVFVPSALFVAGLLVACRATLPGRRLLWLASAAILASVALYSSYIEWWGAHSFGARYMTDIVPWIVLMAVLGLAALRATAPARLPLRRVLWLTAGLALALAGTAVNGAGAVSVAAARWNVEPEDISFTPERLWDWRRPQFLSALIPAPPSTSPAPEASIPPGAVSILALDMHSPELVPLLRGFSAVAEGNFRWSVDQQGEILVALTEPSQTLLQIKASGLYVPGLVVRQRVGISLNGISLGTIEWKGSAVRSAVVAVPPQRWIGVNTLSLDFLDARSPWDLGLSSDRRRLALAVHSLRVYREGEG